jgi:hypothetical protein
MSLRLAPIKPSFRRSISLNACKPLTLVIGSELVAFSGMPLGTRTESSLIPSGPTCRLGRSGQPPDEDPQRAKSRPDRRIMGRITCVLCLLSVRQYLNQTSRRARYGTYRAADRKIDGPLLGQAREEEKAARALASDNKEISKREKHSSETPGGHANPEDKTSHELSISPTPPLLLFPR